GELRSFYVAADFRGTGYAMKLMRACLDHCATRGLAHLMGRTHAANEAMQSVYEMYGFEAKHVTYERKVEPAPARASVTRPRPKPGQGLFRRQRDRRERPEGCHESCRLACRHRLAQHQHAEGGRDDEAHLRDRDEHARGPE